MEAQSSRYCAACECAVPDECGCTHSCGIDNDAARDASGEQPSDPRYETYMQKNSKAKKCPCAACQVDEKDHLLHWAWSIIANGNGGDWDGAAPEWKSAAERWRDAFHDQLVEVHINE